MVSNIGSKIKSKRLELHLTQRDVAEKLFVTQQTVARWEDNKHTPPLNAIQDLSIFFEVKPSYFLEDNLPKSRHINFLALFGSFTFNFLFFWIIAIFLISLLLCLWGTTLGCLFSPLIVIREFLSKQYLISLLRLLNSGILMCVAILVIPLLAKMSNYIYKLTPLLFF